MFVCTNTYHKSVVTRPISSTKANSTTKGKVLYLCKSRGNLTASEIGLLKLYFLEALCIACPSLARVGGSTSRRWCDEKTIRLTGGAAMAVELQRMIRRSRLKNAWVIVFADWQIWRQCCIYFAG